MDRSSMDFATLDESFLMVDESFSFMADDSMQGMNLGNFMPEQQSFIGEDKNMDMQHHRQLSLLRGIEDFKVEQWDTSSDPVHNPVPEKSKEYPFEMDIVDMGVHVSIPRCSPRSDGDMRSIVYHIIISSVFSSWEIMRSHTQFQMLEIELARSLPHCHLPVMLTTTDTHIMNMQVIDATRLRLEQYLQSLLRIRHVWRCLSFEEFFDISNLSMKMENIQLREQLTATKDIIRDMRQQLQLAQSQINSLHERLRNMDENQQILMMQSAQRMSGISSGSSATSSASSPANTMRPLTSPTVPPGLGPGAVGNIQIQSKTGSGTYGVSVTPAMTQGKTVSYNNSAPPSFPYQIDPGSGSGPVQGSASNSTALNVALRKGRPVAVRSNHTAEEKKWDPLSQRYITSVNNPPGLGHSLDSFDSIDSAKPNIPTEFKQIKLVEVRSIPTNDLSTPSPNDIIVKDLIQLAEPCAAQVNYRMLLSSFISKVMRKALNAKVFEVGSFAINAFLPDDPVRVSAFVCRSHENVWHTKLHEKLNAVQSQMAMSEDMQQRDDSMDLEFDIEDGPMFPISSLNIGVDPSHGFYTVACQVAGVNFEILANMRYDLLLAVLLEDFDNLVGKDGLFKRTLLLIRGWWAYESKAYFSGGLRDTLSDSALCVLISSIFNRFHASIFHPLQAFGYFLSEFAGLEWKACAVTLHGPVPLINGAPDLSGIGSVDELFTLEQLARYQEMFREPDAFDGLSGSTSPSPSPDATALQQFNVGYSSSNASARQSRKKFDLQQVNIVHPLCPEMNMVTEALTVSKMQNVQLFLQESANMLQFAYEHSRTSEEASLGEYFRVMSNTFSKGWRPDMPPEDLPDRLYETRERDLDMLALDMDSHASVEGDVGDGSGFASPGLGSPPGSTQIQSQGIGKEMMRDGIPPVIARLLGRVRYCNLVLEGRVTESALLVLCRDIILDRGALPVGEVGKMLQEMTGMTSLSATLKEKFGGLKKFLEKYQNIFIICVDHPFNPHVFLKETLTIEELASIVSGVVPEYLLNKLKKKISRKKKPTSSNQSDIGGGQSLGGISNTMYGQSSSSQIGYNNRSGEVFGGGLVGSQLQSDASLMRLTGQGVGQSMHMNPNPDMYSAGPNVMRSPGTGPEIPVPFGKLTFPGAGASALRFREQMAAGGGGVGGGGPSPAQTQAQAQMVSQYSMSAMPKRGQAAMLAARQRQMMVAYQLQQDPHRQGQGIGLHQHQQLQMQRAYTLTNTDLSSVDLRQQQQQQQALLSKGAGQR